MDLRPLGRSGLQVPPIVLGGNVFGWTADRATSHRLLDAATEAGLVAIDTADMYSTWVQGHRGGESEALIGEWLRASPGRRDRVLILTKVGMEIPGVGNGLAPARIAAAAEASLARLGIERIDLYQAHKDDPATPLADTLGAFGTLIAAGKVRAIGASNYSAARLAEALDVAERGGLPRFESHQPLYNLMERGIEADELPLCHARGVGVIPYSSLASGFLTGKYRSAEDYGRSPRGGRMGRYLETSRGAAVLAALDDAAARHGASPTAVALAWMLAKPGITAPIASASTVEQLTELVRAPSLRLDGDTVAALDAASAA